MTGEGVLKQRCGGWDGLRGIYKENQQHSACTLGGSIIVEWLHGLGEEEVMLRMKPAFRPGQLEVD